MLTVPGVTRLEVEAENESTSDSEEGESDMTLVIKLQSTKEKNPFILFLLALWPFGESFKELGLLGKIYEICKVVCHIPATEFGCLIPPH